jgi:hypothetical protein
MNNVSIRSMTPSVNSRVTDTLGRAGRSVDVMRFAKLLWTTRQVPLDAGASIWQGNLIGIWGGLENYADILITHAYGDFDRLAIG